jgi:hypothetical protein
VIKSYETSENPPKVELVEKAVQQEVDTSDWRTRTEWAKQGNR